MMQEHLTLIFGYKTTYGIELDQRAGEPLLALALTMKVSRKAIEGSFVSLFNLISVLENTFETDESMSVYE